jgi:hypothetical protein
MSADESLAESMAALAEAFDRQEAADELLPLMVSAALDIVPGAQYGGVSVIRDNGRVETVAPSHPLVLQVDDLQYQLDEGPCLEALHQGSAALARNLAVDARWPAYGPRAAELGIHAQLGVQLVDEPRTPCSLNLYAAREDAFSDEAVRLAGLIVRHAAPALRHASLESQLIDAVDSRQTIGQAVGILMWQYQLTDAQAFSYLVRLSQVSNTKVRTVAADLVNRHNRQVEGRVGG